MTSTQTQSGANAIEQGDAPAANTKLNDKAGSTSRRVKLVFRVLVSLALLATVIARIGDEALLVSLRRGMERGGWLLCAIVLPPALGYTISMLRLGTLLGVHKIVVAKTKILRAQLMGTFFNQILPTSIGGDVHRVWYLGQHAGGYTAIVTSIFVARVLGVVAMCLLVLSGSLINPIWFVDIPALKLSVPAAAALVLVFVAVLLRVRPPSVEPDQESGRVRAGWHKLLSSLSRFRGHPSVLAAALGYSLVLQLEIVLQYWLFSWCLGVDLTFDRLLVAVPLVTLADMIPISLNGVGVREWVMVWICTPLGIVEADAAMTAMMFMVAGFFYAAIGGMIFIRTSHARVADHHPSSA
jgi:uncharacterized protein (TIRG00374 family)